MTQHYEIRVKGHLDETWADWFDGMEVQHESNGETVLTLPLPDQSALHGVLNRLRDMTVQLVSVNQIEAPQPSEEHDTHSG
jgi:hypothetical protein